MFFNLLKKKKQELERQVSILEASVVNYNKKLTDITAQIANKIIDLNKVKKQLDENQRELDITSGIIDMEEYGLEYKPLYNNSIEIATRLTKVQREIGELLGTNQIIISTRVYRVDGSEVKGAKFQKAYCDNLLIGFNTYFEKKKKAVTAGNYNKTLELLAKKFDQTNKKAELLGVKINEQYFDLMVELLQLELDDKINKAEEKERIKEEKRKLKEQEALLIEAEKEKKKLEEERKNLHKLFSQAITEEDQENIRNKLAEVDKRVKEIDWRIEHQSAGWLYIATTPCLEGMYKAGCTRQLSPFTRLAQISSASVPFPFKCNALVFSEDVFDLEARLHRRLDSVRVNKDNKKKEFFYGKPQDAIDILQKEFHEDVHFIDEDWLNKESEDSE